jgi:hypothetical protein
MTQTALALRCGNTSSRGASLTSSAGAERSGITGHLNRAKFPAVSVRRESGNSSPEILTPPFSGKVGDWIQAAQTVGVSSASRRMELSARLGGVAARMRKRKSRTTAMVTPRGNMLLCGVLGVSWHEIEAAESS